MLQTLSAIPNEMRDVPKGTLKGTLKGTHSIRFMKIMFKETGGRQK